MNITVVKHKRDVTTKLPNAIYIGRSASVRKQYLLSAPHLANPYRMGKDGDRQEVIRKFKSDLWKQINTGGPALVELLNIFDRARTGDVTLCCHCALEPREWGRVWTGPVNKDILARLEELGIGLVMLRRVQPVGGPHNVPSDVSPIGVEAVEREQGGTVRGLLQSEQDTGVETTAILSVKELRKILDIEVAALSHLAPPTQPADKDVVQGTLGETLGTHPTRLSGESIALAPVATTGAQGLPARKAVGSHAGKVVNGLYLVANPASPDAPFVAGVTVVQDTPLVRDAHLATGLELLTGPTGKVGFLHTRIVPRRRVIVKLACHGDVIKAAVEWLVSVTEQPDVKMVVEELGAKILSMG